MTDRHDIGCDEAIRRLAEFVDRELADGERREVERHLETCRSCFSRVEFERRLKDQLAVLSSDEVPPRSVERIRGLIKGF